MLRCECEDGWDLEEGVCAYQNKVIHARITFDNRGERVSASPPPPAPL